MGMTGFAETGHSCSANTGPTMTADGPGADSQLLAHIIAKLPVIGFRAAEPSWVEREAASIVG